MLSSWVDPSSEEAERKHRNSEYRQVYIGATKKSVGIAKRICQHWAGREQCDRLIWGGSLRNSR